MINLPPEPARGQDILTWAQDVQRVLRALRPQPGVGIRISEGANSFTISTDPSRRSLAVSAYHPFKVITSPKQDSNSGQIQAGVIYRSALYQSLKPDDKLAITGLLTSDHPNPDDDGWRVIEPTDAIWLEIIFDEQGKPESAAIKSWGKGDNFEIAANAWSGNNSYCEDDGNQQNPKHKTSRKLIAYTVPGESGEPVLTQVMFHDQVLRNVCIDGRPAKYPFAHEGGYPL